MKAGMLTILRLLSTQAFAAEQTASYPRSNIKVAQASPARQQIRQAYNQCKAGGHTCVCRDKLCS
jgi:hypothetical protein